MLRLVEIDKPSARTVHGLIPTPAVMINDSPRPNKVNPKQRINTVKGDGEKFNGLSELLVIGIIQLLILFRCLKLFLT